MLLNLIISSTKILRNFDVSLILKNGCQFDYINCSKLSFNGLKWDPLGKGHNQREKFFVPHC